MPTCRQRCRTDVRIAAQNMSAVPNDLLLKGLSAAAVAPRLHLRSSEQGGREMACRRIPQPKDSVGQTLHRPGGRIRSWLRPSSSPRGISRFDSSTQKNCDIGLRRGFDFSRSGVVGKRTSPDNAPIAGSRAPGIAKRRLWQ